MPTDSGERRPVKSHHPGGGCGGAPPSENENLPCPRCDSTNTKFCYYNNYNLSQPRHFCKSCRRYWTQGGALRNIPVGGGTRKNAKRSRTCSSASLDHHHQHDHQHQTISATPVSVISAAAATATSETTDNNTSPPLRFHHELDLNYNVNNVTSAAGSFTSLLNTQGAAGGFLALGGFGLGLGSGFDEMSFELGRSSNNTVWAPLMTEHIGEPGGGGAGAGGGGDSADTWHIGNGVDHGGFVDAVGDCFAWPELAISTTTVRRDQKA